MNQNIFFGKHNWNNWENGLTIKVNLLDVGKNHLLDIDIIQMSFFYHGNQAGLSVIKRKSRHYYTILAYLYVHE